jgi:chemotaxis receptor (MCP) glutamine deamidase CheD
VSPAVATERTTPYPPPELEKEVTIFIGGIHAASDAEVVKTLLGSCISVCLFDPMASVGGMNHFMLPDGGGDSDPSELTRFGVHAMDVLIGAMIKLGGDRRRFVAKFFGGAHVLDVQESASSVPQQNIAFIRRFLAEEGFAILAEDVGGYHPRHVRFYTSTGRALVKRVQGDRARTRLLESERRRATFVPTYGGVELFD